jgi:hypothetical protein
MKKFGSSYLEIFVDALVIKALLMQLENALKCVILGLSL